MAYLILDLGSSSVRALRYEGNGTPAPGLLARRPHAFHTGANGAVTADFAALAALVEGCVDEALAHPAARTIEAAGMAAFAGSLVGLDAKGDALTPAFTYADTQPAADAMALARETDAHAAHQRTGCRLHPAYQPARLRWLARTQPGIFARSAQWADVSTALYRRWFGRPVPMSHSIAAWSGLLNRAALGWDENWLAVLGMNSRQFPELADWREAQVRLAPSYAARWPALKDVPFFLPVGDGAAANIGSGGGAGVPVLTLGTTGAIRVIRSAPQRPLPGALWEYCVDDGRRLLGGATSEGGSTADWCRSALELTLDDLETALARPADGHGLTALPLLAGERSPGWNVSATGTLHGLNAGSDRLAIAQALLEGVGLRLRAVADALEVRGEPLLAGGGALDALPSWAAVIASAIGCPLRLIDEREPTARGVALLLGEALSPGAQVDPVGISAEIAPDAEAAARFEAAAERQQALYHALYG